jgi:hypothetical protein
MAATRIAASGEPLRQDEHRAGTKCSGAWAGRAESLTAYPAGKRARSRACAPITRGLVQTMRGRNHGTGAVDNEQQSRCRRKPISITFGG